MWRPTSAGPVAPSARAARTYSVSESASTAPRTIRVTGGVPQMPTAIVVLSAPGPSADTTAMASKRYGNARSTSTARMMPPSTQPPRKPARLPRTNPRPSAIPTDTRPTRRAIRAP